MAPILNTGWANPRCLFGVNLVILTQIHHKLSWGQAKFPTSPSQNYHNCLEGQCQWATFSIPTESIPGCMFGETLVIPTQICDELLCRQDQVYGQTDEWMDKQDRLTDTGKDYTPLAWKTKGQCSNNQQIFESLYTVFALISLSWWQPILHMLCCLKQPPLLWKV